MSGLNILGGVGAGLLRGSQFVQQKNVQDEQLRLQQEQQRQNKEFRDAALALQQTQAEQATELHGARMKEATHAQDERARVERLSTLQNELVQQYPDANDYQRHQLLVDAGVRENLFRGDELTKAFDVREKLRQRIGVKAYDAALAGDISPLQQLLGEQGVAVDYAPDRKGFVLNSAAGRQEISRDGLLQMEAMAGALERARANAKAALEARKLKAEIGDKEASAELKLSTADLRDRTDPNLRGSSGSGSGSGKSSGKGGDWKSPFGAEDIARVAPDLPDGGKDSATGMSIVARAENILQGNPNFRGSPAQALDIARRTFLPEGHADRYAIEPLRDDSGQYFVGTKTPDGAVYIGKGAGHAVDPRRPDLLDKDRAAAGRQSAAIQATDEAWMQQFANRADPKTLELVGPYLTAGADLSWLKPAQEIPVEKLRAAVANESLSEDARNSARVALFARENPGFFDVAARVNAHGRRGKTVGGGAAMGDNAEAHGRAYTRAADALLLLRSGNKTLDADAAKAALAALEKYPDLAERLKVKDQDIAALTFVAKADE